jgi:hypothetical protein
MDTLIDFITGQSVNNIGTEETRQALERFLVEKKGFFKDDVLVDCPIKIAIGKAIYESKLDLVIEVNKVRFMAVKCAAGSLESWGREIISAARILEFHPLPVAMSSDAKNAMVWDALTGRKIGMGLEAVPDRGFCENYLKSHDLIPLPENKIHKEKIIFRSYDGMNVNRNPAVS